MPRQTEDRVYRSGPRYQQKHFPDTRRTTRLSMQPSSGRSNQQSTLTQLDFACTPSSSFAFPEDDLSDSEFQEPRKTKRRKKHHESKTKQTTLTQLVSSFEEPHHGENLPWDLENAIQETQWRPDPEFDISKLERDPHSHDEVGLPDFKYSRVEQDVVRESPTTDSSKELRHPSPAAHSSPLKTPSKRFGRNQVIPSSETPQSIHFTAHSRGSSYSPSRSPLQERSTNPVFSPVLASQHGDQTPDKNGAAYLEDQDERHSNDLLVSPIIFRKPQIPVRRDETQTIKASPQKHHRTRNVVQDSQIDDVGETLEYEQLVDSTYIPGTELPHVVASQYHSSATDLSMPASIYDPVGSALDRDAARFGETQRLDLPTMAQDRSGIHTAPSVNVSGFDGAVDEELDMNTETRDYAYGARSSVKHSAETIDLTSDLPSQPGTPTSTAATPERHRHNVPQHVPNPTDLISPLKPRPSQATTVDGTQSGPPSPSRVPQTCLPRSSPPIVEDRSSPPPPPIPSSPQLGSSPPKTRRHLHSSFEPYTLASTCQGSSQSNRYRYRQEIEDSQVEDLDNEEITEAKRRRLKRAQEVLPDSLLDFSMPMAPPLTSSATAKEDDPVAVENAGSGDVQLDMTGLPGASDSAEVENQDASCGNKDHNSPAPPAARKDYSLAPPSSGWRSSGRTR